MLIPLKSSSPVLVMISSMPVPICNRFTLDEPLAVKYFWGGGVSGGGTLPSHFRSKGPPHPAAQNFVTKN